MITELVEHYDRHCDVGCDELDWSSSSRFTRVVRYGNSTDLYPILNQVPDAVTAEYRLEYKSHTVFTWKDYRWPHLVDANTVKQNQRDIVVPDDCFGELLNYHQDADTGWLDRYRATLVRDNAA